MKTKILCQIKSILKCKKFLFNNYSIVFCATTYNANMSQILNSQTLKSLKIYFGVKVQGDL